MQTLILQAIFGLNTAGMSWFGWVGLLLVLCIIGRIGWKLINATVFALKRSNLKQLEHALPPITKAERTQFVTSRAVRSMASRVLMFAISFFAGVAADQIYAAHHARGVYAQEYAAWKIRSAEYREAYAEWYAEWRKHQDLYSIQYREQK
jgi:hypothetical protein